MNAKILFADSKYLHHSGKLKAVPEQIPHPQLTVSCSVIIPCYNYGVFLKDAIQSCLNQTLKLIEIIVVDDGSTDNETKEILQSLIHDRRLTVVLKRNEGLSEARNAGIRLAKGKYICCLDADDILHPTYLEHCLYELESDGYRGMAYSWVRLFGDENHVWQTRDFDFAEARQDNHTSVAAVFRKSDWLLAGTYSHQMQKGYEDWEFWLRLMQLGRKGYTIKAPLFFHRRHGTTMTHSAHHVRNENVAKIKELNPKLFTDAAWNERLAEITRRSDKAYPLALEKNQRMDRPALLCVLPWLTPGGAETLMADILRAFSKDFHICIVTTCTSEHELLPQFQSITNDIFHFPENNSLKEFILFLTYLSCTRQTRYIFTSGSRRMYEALPHMTENSSTCFRVVDLLHNNMQGGHISNSIKYNRHIAGTICVSQKIVQSLTDAGIPRDKCVCIPNGIDGSNIFTPDEQKRRRITFKQGNLDTRIIGFVGRASQEKRPFLFLELIKRLSAKMNVHGLMLSSGYMEPEILRKINEEHLSIEMLPVMERTDLPNFYRQLDILVNVSSIEGMPLTVIEAMACGCPVAAMKVGNLSDVITHRDSGIVVDADDTEALILELEDFLRDSNRISQGKLRARARFEELQLDLHCMTQQYKNRVYSYLGLNRTVVNSSK